MDRPNAPIDLARVPDFQLGPVRLKPASREVEGEGWKEVLEPRVMQVLIALAEAGGDVVSRDELVRRCWEGRVVSEDAISRCVAKIRRLSDAGDRPSFTVDTIPRVGYRLGDAVPEVIAQPAREDPPSRISICVLPFANMSGDPEQEYFSDGVTDDIITDLSKVSALSVVSRNTAFTFKGKAFDLAQAAKQLKVSHLLEGSVRKVGERVRITAQLIDGAHDNHVWAERYDRDLKDIFALQDEISETIVTALKLKLLPSEKKAIEQRSTSDPEAYKLYLMARQYSVTGNMRHREVIIRLCRRAVEIDPKYARAWALLAINEADCFQPASASETGWEAAERALSLEPDLAEAHAARGRVLADKGRYDEALAEHATALRLDPDSYDVNIVASNCFMCVHRFDDAIRCLEKAASITETDFRASGMLIQCYRDKGDSEGERAAARRALARVEKLIAAQPEHGSAMSFGVCALVALGETERAREWTERAMLLDPDNANLRYNLACSKVIAGAFDQAMDLLEPILGKAKPQAVAWMRTDSDLDPVRELPRFKAMMKQAEERLALAERAAASEMPH